MKIYPKLNIFLNVLPKRSNGLHPIFSRFVLARGGLYDEMEVCFGSDEFQILGDFDCALEHNLIFRAKEELKIAYPKLALELDHLRVEVEKKIPQGSGLGGGSANAGAFLLLMGREFGIPKEKLSNIAPKIGSDVAFFVSEYESANVSGYGEIIEEYVELSHYEYEIFTPPLVCETKRVYETFDSLALSVFSKIDFLSLSSTELLYGYSIEELNDLYLPALRAYPSLLKVVKKLGSGWFFSGSGSSFFRIKR